MKNWNLYLRLRIVWNIDSTKELFENSIWCFTEGVGFVADNHIQIAEPIPYYPVVGVGHPVKSSREPLFERGTEWARSVCFDLILTTQD